MRWLQRCPDSVCGLCPRSLVLARCSASDWSGLRDLNTLPVISLTLLCLGWSLAALTTYSTDLCSTLVVSSLTWAHSISVSISVSTRACHSCVKSMLGPRESGVRLPDRELPLWSCDLLHKKDLDFRTEPFFRTYVVLLGIQAQSYNGQSGYRAAV